METISATILIILAIIGTFSILKFIVKGGLLIIWSAILIAFNSLIFTFFHIINRHKINKSVGE